MGARSPPIGVLPRMRWRDFRISFRIRGRGPRSSRCRAATSSMTGLRFCSGAPSANGAFSPMIMRGGWWKHMARVSIKSSAKQLPYDLGQRFGADLTAAELHYLMTKEWEQTADD